MLETEQLFAKQQQHHYSHSRFLSSNLGNPTNPSTSALATTEDKKRRQLDIYAYHGFTGNKTKGSQEMVAATLMMMVWERSHEL
jgi:hypothetical protein